MKWVAADVEMYQKAAEYVDTAIVPLLPVSFGEDMKQNASMAEFTRILTSQLEKQFRGRIFLLPDFVYIKEDEGSQDALKNWENTLLDKHFNHIFYVTSDSRWRQREKDLKGSVLWIPSLSLDQMPDEQKVAIVDGQVKQLLSLFTEKWDEK
ncbi:YpiF family protein [Bacillus sp. ISL-35]|uniref:YpiF family protein n=1 Tax=Bacillus sp. ISL-35 TaxID=2819122 RepID=UPI001BE7C5C9|nr:YpiF family protein [Bacillus sp. ISL-35]MBT2677724.1 YpiF family protein [Bacillus sp. ISL-35]MBT2704562.1 YpiF family protein [Chryseobacterium sp. ISL-80]